ncbi:type II secretion system F family protein [Pseudarthrobacter sp. S9]|uniref:type II secretion system F family protein n=1 Tax=Pseudarthrobacter sp. S9 TaxID=3418421 RepID=UPI003D08F08B
MLPELSPLAFAAGLLLVYAALAITFTVVLKSRSAVPLARRRPDQAQGVPASGLSKLTDQAVQTLNKGLRSRGSGLLSREKLEDAGLKKQPGDYLLMAGSATFVASVLGFLMGGPFFAVLMLVLAPVGLVLFLNVLVSRRRKKFDEQVPDTLQMFAGGLRAGHSLLRSVDAAAQENEAPMAEELNRVVNETRIGRDLGESLADVARRTDNEDFGSIARAIEIHREVGGDLAQVLDHVGETIRDRNQIRGQIRALSAEGRMSAMVLLGLPVVMFVGLTLFNPYYSRVFLTTLPGYLMVVAALVLMAVGGFWLSRLIKPKF